MKNLKLIFTMMIIALATNVTMYAQISSATISFLNEPEDMIGCYNEINRVIGVVAANENSTNTLSFQWFKDGMPLTAGVDTPFEVNQAGFSFGPLQHSQAGLYQCLVWDNDVLVDDGWPVDAVQSWIDLGLDINTIHGIISIYGAQMTRMTTVHVVNTPNITRQPMTVMARTGETVYMDVEGTMYGELPPSYQTTVQWYAGNTALADNDDFEGTQSSYITVHNAEKYYNAEIWCQLTGYCGTVNSATVTISPRPGVQLDQDVMGETEVCAGESNTFTVMASATNGGDDANLMYQWYAGGSMLMDGADVQGAMTNTLVWTVAAGVTSDIYCEVTYGTDGESVMSTMTSVTGLEAPKFSADLADQEVDEGDDLVLEAMASGDNVTYTWYMESNTMSIGEGSSLTITAVEEGDSGLYYCVASNDCGTDQTNSASITVKTSGIVASVDNAERFNLNVSPNPSQGLSNVTFNLTSAQNVSVVLSNSTGLEIATLANGFLPKGLNSFEINANKFNLSAGVYYITMVTENGIATRKLVYVR